LETCLARFQGKLQAFFGIIKLMKKIIVISLFVVVSLSFGGCQPKGISEEVAPANETTSEEAPLTEDTLTAQEPVPASTVDVEAIDNIFNQNFSLALEDAKKNLGENTKFCFVKISFLGGVISTKGKMDFFFENSQKIANYYWLVSFDSTSPENQKKRYLAAQKDWGEQSCTTMETPPSFATAYNNFAKAGKLDTVTTALAARTDMTLVDKLWKIELFSISGETIFSETESATPTASTSVTPSPTPQI
jgi:hypothetical protein